MTAPVIAELARQTDTLPPAIGDRAGMPPRFLGRWLGGLLTAFDDALEVGWVDEEATLQVNHR